MGIEALAPYHDWFLLIHILAAIVALGANVTYAFWLSIAERDRGHLDFAIGGISRIDRVLSNPAYAVLLLTGILLMLAGEYTLEHPWLVTAIVLYFVSGVLSVTQFTPAIRAQLVAGAEGPGSAAYLAAARRSRLMAWLGVTVVVVIVFLMVVKPTF